MEKISDTISGVLERNLFAVLAAQLNGEAHANLIAFIPLKGPRFIAFATYGIPSNTRAYSRIQW